MPSPGEFKFTAAFRIIDSANLHAEITSRISAPSSTASRGDPIPHLTGRKVSHDMWVFDSPLPEECSWSEHLDWLDQKLRPHITYLRTLRERGVEMDIYLGYRSDHDYSEFQICPGSFDIAAAIGVPISITLIVA
jgi:hypothetical protein